MPLRGGGFAEPRIGSCLLGVLNLEALWVFQDLCPSYALDCFFLIEQNTEELDCMSIALEHVVVFFNSCTP